MRLLVVLLLCAGCVSYQPGFAYSEVSAIKPGVTTRGEIMKSFGEPKGFFTSDADTETFWFDRGGDYNRSRLTVHLTNGVVWMFNTSAP